LRSARSLIKSPPAFAGGVGIEARDSFTDQRIIISHFTTSRFLSSPSAFEFILSNEIFLDWGLWRDSARILARLQASIIGSFDIGR
jgi:hypothetical protein